jgi:GNAT superfamily N-acetyltransferase
MEGKQNMGITYRQATLEDTHTMFQIFEQSIMDLGDRLGVMTITGGDDPAVREQLWIRRRSLVEHLTRTAEHCWLAEINGEAIGYARTIFRGGIRELTDFFVLPGQQSAGVGRELLGRAFPLDGADHRVIIATVDTRALARYLKSGVYPRSPIYYFERKPEPVTVETDLVIKPSEASPETLAILGAIDQVILGYRRDVDHTWLLEHRQGYVYYRDGQPVGYSYLGDSTGPVALLTDSDFPAVLAHAEKEAAEQERTFGVEVPLINQAAVDYLLARGFQMETFMAYFMNDAPFGKYENYIFTSPPFFS